MKDKILKFVLQYRLVIICLIILLLFGYSLKQIQPISNPKSDENYLNSRRGSTVTTNQLQIKDEVRKQIEALQHTPVSTKPGRLGTSDPFNP